MSVGFRLTDMGSGGPYMLPPGGECAWLCAAQGSTPLSNPTCTAHVTVTWRSCDHIKGVVCGHCLVTLSFTINETLKWLSLLPILMQESSSISRPSLFPSLWSRMVSVDVKHRVYWLTTSVRGLHGLLTSSCRVTQSTRKVKVERNGRHTPSHFVTWRMTSNHH